MYKVFLVEDEIVVREGIRNNINWEQYGFIYAGDAPDGELALPLIRDIQPDLLITDIRMPFMDGLALIELVRKELPRTKIVIVSGYDDFSYAQKAIKMGVEQYLLKPMEKDKMVELLETLHRKMDEENKQLEYFMQFQNEAQEYEAFSRRRLFEQIVTGGLSVSEISETAKTLDIDLNALYYNIVLFSLNNAGFNRSTPESYTDTLAMVQDKVMGYLVNDQELVLFRWNVTTYAVLIKGSQESIMKKTNECIGNIQSRCAMAGSDVDWYVACGVPVSRLSEIPSCFTEVSRVLSYRYLSLDKHVLSESSIQEIRKKYNSETESDINVQEIDQDRISNFLNNGEIEEISHFVDQLLQSAGDKIANKPMFCGYLAMTVYLSADEYLDTMGWRADSFWPQKFRPNVNLTSPEQVKKYTRKVIEHVIELRDSESKKQHRDILIQALKFIDEHYFEESVSLDRVAKKVNISPNYFSAMFSQDIGQTFVEYLTNKRVEEAKRLLIQTEKRSSEIAFAVGYKDAHYFSYVFKKVSGCTPSEYRRGKK